MWVGKLRLVPMIKITTTKPRGPELKALSETINAGRRPDCSRPIVGFKFTSQISPLAGLTMLLLLFIGLLLLFESVSES